MDPGMATFKRTSEDNVTMAWESEDGWLMAMELDLRRLASLRVGEPAGFCVRPRSYAPRVRIAALRARIAALRAQAGREAERLEL